MPRRELTEVQLAEALAKRDAAIAAMRRMTSDDVLTPGEVAAIFRVDPKTVNSWSRNDRITCVFTPGGHRRYRVGVVRRLMEEVG